MEGISLSHRGCSFQRDIGGRDTKEGRQTVFFTPLLQTKQKKSTTTYQSQKIKASKRRLLDPLNQSTIKRIAALADKGLTPLSSRIQCQPIAPKKWIHAASRSKNNTQKRPGNLSSSSKAHKSSSGKPVAEENPLNVELKIQEIPQNAMLKDQGRKNKIQELVDKLRSEYQTESCQCQLE